WGEVGAVATSALRHRLANAGLHSIDPAEGMRLVIDVLGGPVPQVIALNAEEVVLEKLCVDASRPSQAHAGQMPSGGQLADRLADLENECFAAAPIAASEGFRALEAY